ncbi:unnamed protein product [Rhizophagus irregularis]|nr:unnamed protein product [Rhizophagus irregularis]CAB4388773.1 unnamed protein product [Rhizophagus irregularis]CAB5380301.1 unnamed protein product [Rhizophagus irregularis]CAB5380381.1 unnamed protein product [Rhizophagus irregularis]
MKGSTCEKLLISGLALFFLARYKACRGMWKFSQLSRKKFKQIWPITILVSSSALMEVMILRSIILILMQLGNIAKEVNEHMDPGSPISEYFSTTPDLDKMVVYIR